MKICSSIFQNSLIFFLSPHLEERTFQDARLYFETWHLYCSSLFFLQSTAFRQWIYVWQCSRRLWDALSTHEQITETQTCAFFSLFYFHFPWLNIFHQPVTVIKLSQSTVNRGMPALTNQAEDIASCRLLARMSFPANSEWASKSASTCMVCVIVHISAYNSAEIMLSNSREWFRAGDLSLNGS